MFKVGAIVWIMLGTVLAGTAVLAVLATPGLAGESEVLIPALAAAGYAIAIPISLVVAKRIVAATGLGR
jgi:hypothetical protein